MNYLISPDVDIRDAFFNGLYEVVENDKNVMILTADHGAFGLNKIKEDFPEQYINVGIAEQNMVSVAAGLALCGKIVYIYSIVNFVTLRCLDQINIDIASMNLNVNIIGVGAGFTYSTDGPTHHGTQDVAIMSAIPNISIYNCSDSISAYAYAKIGYKESGPKYFRIDKGVVPTLHKADYSFNKGIASVKNGNRTIIASSGVIIHKAIQAAKIISAKGYDVGVLDIYRIKPINEQLFVELIAGADKLLIIEDNIATGGLCEKAASILLRNKLFVDIHFLNIGDVFSFNYSKSRNNVEDLNNLKVSKIVRRLVKV